MELYENWIQFCPEHGFQMGRRLSDPPVRERFESKWTPEPNCGCWLWLAGVQKRRNSKSNTYGTFTINNITMHAHRAAWIIYRGEHPGTLYVLHKCDNPYCVNPEHLFLGTHLDNMRDMIAKKRQVIQYGTESHFAKLTDEIVAAIFNDTRMGTVIANEYGVSPSTVSLIKLRKTWRRAPNLPTAVEPKPPRTHCLRGHEINPINIYIRKNGKRGCRVCARNLRREKIHA